VFDPLVVVKLIATLVLAGSLVAACKLPPPARARPNIALALASGAVAACIAGAMMAPGGAPLLGLAVLASATATWLMRAPGDDDDGEPPEEPDPDAPDPNAFDWDEFERAARSGAPTARR